MDAKSMKRKVFSTLLLISLIVAGCGTLQIDLEPTTAPIEAEPSTEPAGAVAGARSGEPEQVADEVVGQSGAEETAVSESEVSESEQEISEPEAELVGAGPTGNYLTYQNAEYGFTLTFPPTWTVAEVNGEDFVGPGSRSIQLSQGTVKLVIGYRRVGEESRIGGSGAPAGEFVEQGSITVLGINVSRQVLQFEGKDKAVFYGRPGALIQAGGLELAPRLDDFAQIGYGQIDISRNVQDEADLILSSMALIGDSAGGGAGVVEFDYTGWNSYTNESLGYSLMHPGNTDVMGGDLNQAVEFVGPVVGNDHWPWFFVEHFDSAFYRPPAGTDVRQWIAVSNIPYEPEEQGLTIGGLPSVHFIIEASPQAYGRDEYYLIHGQRLIHITILHPDGRQDQTLYDQFLQSITFETP